MAENSNIEWTHHTFNPWTGCSKVSAGCANCYAENLMDKRYHKAQWGPNGTRVVASENYWRQPLKWDKAAAKAGERHRVFCASLADVFEDWQGPMVNADGHEVYDVDGVYMPCNAGQFFLTPRDKATMSDVRTRLFALIDATPNLDWLLLTKRPENIATMMPPIPVCQPAYGTCKRPAGHDGQHNQQAEPRSNVWLGISVEDQQRADERIPHLLQVPAAVRFLSVEPQIGPIEFSLANNRPDCRKILGTKALAGIDWVIVGGESGHGARPMNIEWARSIVKQCKTAGVACFVKQLGSQPHDLDDGSDRPNAGTLMVLDDRKGGDPAEWPEDLRVREFPKAGTLAPT